MIVRLSFVDGEHPYWFVYQVLVFGCLQNVHLLPQMALLVVDSENFSSPECCYQQKKGRNQFQFLQIANLNYNYETIYRYSFSELLMFVPF